MKYLNQWKNFFKSRPTPPQEIPVSTKGVDYKKVEDQEFYRKRKKMTPNVFTTSEVDLLKNELKEYRMRFIYSDKYKTPSGMTALTGYQIHFERKKQEIDIYKVEDNWYYVKLFYRYDDYAQSENINHYYFECDDLQSLLNCIRNEISSN